MPPRRSSGGGRPGGHAPRSPRAPHGGGRPPRTARAPRPRRHYSRGVPMRGSTLFGAIVLVLLILGLYSCF